MVEISYGRKRIGTIETILTNHKNKVRTEKVFVYEDSSAKQLFECISEFKEHDKPILMADGNSITIQDFYSAMFDVPKIFLSRQAYQDYCGIIPRN